MTTFASRSRLNKLKIVENTNNKTNEKIKIKRLLAMQPFRDSEAPSWLCGPRADVPAEHPFHMPC